MTVNKHNLYMFACGNGLSENLCLLLHAKEVECLSFHRFPMPSPPFVAVLQEGIEDGCNEDELVKMALGDMGYFLRCDVAFENENPRMTDRRCAIEGGEKTYRKFLTPEGKFDYQKYFNHLKSSHDGQLAAILATTGHPLP